MSTFWRNSAAVVVLSCFGPLSAQTIHRPLSLDQSRYRVAAGERVQLRTTPESFAVMRSAKTAAARTIGQNPRRFAVGPNVPGDRILLGVPLATPPGEYSVELVFAGVGGEVRTAAAQVTVEPFAVPATSSATPPVVLLDGFQLSLTSSCPMAANSAGTFGNLQTYLNGAPNLVPAVYFFENCTECPNCSIEELGADLGTFLDALPYPQVDVVAHSMGGLIVRSYLSGKQATSGAFHPPATPRIRKAVFLATPHFGSFLADSQLADALLAGIQTDELKRASGFLWDLATWNQFGDDLRGVDGLALVASGGPSQQSDGVVGLTSGSLEFAQPGKTRILPDYCHIPLAAGFEASFLGCVGPGIANVDSSNHPTYLATSSFLMDGAQWQTVGRGPAQDPYLSKSGGVVVADISAADQFVGGLAAVSWGTVNLTDGARSGVLFYDDLVSGTATFNFGSSTCGPYTQVPGVYSAVRCKSGPAIESVGPPLPGAGKVVQAGTTITINGIGFGAQPCAACQVTAANPQSASLQVVSWSDSSIRAILPASFGTGLAAIGVTTADGSDAIDIMAGTATPVTVTAIRHSATGLPGPIAPGELITLYGTGLGPTAGTMFSADPATGMVDTTLAGTRVFFGSIAAPITYTSATQINVIAPYEIADQAQVVIQAQYQGRMSASQTAPVVAASPGAYTLDASGAGPVVAVNQDGTLNGPNHPAPQGSYVTIYFTGGGETNPPGVTGSVTGAVLKWLVQPISVTVGNVSAMVTFDGSAPTLVDGVDQLNIRLGPDTPSGPQPMAITVGGMSSPSSVTLAVQ